MLKLIGGAVLLMLFAVFTLIVFFAPTVGGPASVGARRATAVREARQGR